ncbi:hypothetical protein IscW_ISCW007250 [Ixodes scapularis]|uniref:Uncharacterized protein n=1 Tax=Ixodes scapularis TaxID=6945 RepID=B7PVG4_IXOSC|nr:hypothetical protein IscW_ISCW007250 [Ixodes scapularis]|eukprot:XP_002407921.1 hypothetical protein IscW_ISCW007250 [Ixodes scapularis]
MAAPQDKRPATSTWPTKPTPKGRQINSRRHEPQSLLTAGRADAILLPSRADTLERPRRARRQSPPKWRGAATRGAGLTAAAPSAAAPRARAPRPRTRPLAASGAD